jgi:hypothetical protein
MVAEGIRKAGAEIVTAAEAPPGMAHYQDDPIGFMTAELGIRRETLVWSELPEYEGHIWDGTPDPLAAWFRATAEWKDVGVESGTGTGKSFGLALVKLWFLASWQGARCFDFASKKDQLSEYSWMELGKLWPRFKVLFPSATLGALRIRMDGKLREGDSVGWGAFGQGVEVGAATEIAAGAAGMHAPHMHISVEEAQEFHQAASQGLENTCTAPHNLRTYVGNPDSQDDALHQFCELESTVHIRISALDHPNIVCNNARDPEWSDVKGDVMIVPGAVSRASILRRLRRYGVEHRHYQSRVRGISPPEHQEALIRQVWLDRAADRWRAQDLRWGFPGLGVDVARSEDGDKAAIADGLGAHLDEVISFPCPDVAQLGVRLAVMITTRDIHERHVGVDVGGGYGGGTVDKLKELGIYVQAINPGSLAVPSIDETLLDEKGEVVREEVLYRNERAAMAWRLALDLQMNRIALPPDQELHEDLRSIRWKSVLGKIQVEEKAEVMKRLGRSPDKGDSVLLWNRVRERIHPEEETELGAWDKEALLAELEHRRIRDTPSPRDPAINPSIIERID